MTSVSPLISLDPIDTFPSLAEIPQPPKAMTMRGTLEHCVGKKHIAFVGSRTCTSYGINACQTLIEHLKGYPIVIVSGLALGIDAVAHIAALDAGLTTLAFPGSGLSEKTLYPAQHRALAERIISAGGALLSEYKPEQRAAPWTFPNRNRLMAGISDMIVVIEAEEKSGTLITARLATEYNKSVGAVPGPITSPTSKGAHWLLKLGATPITEAADILQEVGIAPQTTTDISSFYMLNTQEERIISILHTPKTKDAVIAELNLDPVEAMILFSTLEIKGVIRETLGTIERVC